MPGLRGIRARLAGVLVALVAATALVLGLGASLLVDARLHQQVLEEAGRQAAFDLSVVVPGRQLPSTPSRAAIVDSRLIETFANRGVQTIVDVGEELPVVSRNDLFDVFDALPPELRQRVDRGEIGFAWLPAGGQPALVVGGRPAGGGPAFYFVRSVDLIDEALSQLRIALAGGALVLIVVALLIARLVARGVLAPVEAASRAAARIEQGDLTARVPVLSRDEFGSWAEQFNRMATAQAELIGRLRAAQAQNRRFVADVSHELRTPLTALVAEASIVNEHLETMPPESRRAAELLVGDVGRLRSLVEELMELSRFDAEAEQAAVEPVDLVRLVRAVAGSRLPSARFDPPAPSLVVDTDRRRLERILGNFLDNAREHAGGQEVEIELVVDRSKLVLAVSDRGQGVPPEGLERIFERFTKIDPSRHGGSSGLGLAIAAEHAALLGGHVEARNRAEGGLRLALVLPGAVARSLPGGDGTVMPAGQPEAPSSTAREPLR